MPLSARAYLLDRFRSDAVALHQRAASLASAPRGAPRPGGPDADTSRLMALACEAVVAMMEAVPEAEDARRALANISALLPLLEHLAAQETGGAPVRAVYVGAATRIREVEAAEARADSRGAPQAHPSEHDGSFGEDENEDDSAGADGQAFSDDDPDIDDDDPSDDR